MLWWTYNNNVIQWSLSYINSHSSEHVIPTLVFMKIYTFHCILYLLWCMHGFGSLWSLNAPKLFIQTWFPEFLVGYDYVSIWLMYISSIWNQPCFFIKTYAWFWVEVWCRVKNTLCVVFWRIKAITYLLVWEIGLGFVN